MIPIFNVHPLLENSRKGPDKNTQKDITSLLLHDQIQTAFDQNLLDTNRVQDLVRLKLGDSKGPLQQTGGHHTRSPADQNIIQGTLPPRFDM